ncbi:CoA transferase [Cumulibacter soli]|uniref:CoA transferase n=1 Tax=Cumulibacter soli TaxID=2546344 RepID=UPI00106732B3|nr:CoA transferase [Cumulibacter soli]
MSSTDATSPPLAGWAMPVLGAGPAAAYARNLAAICGADVSTDANGRPLDLSDAPDALADWAASGAMWLSGHARAAPMIAPGAPASAMTGALAMFEHLAGSRSFHDSPPLSSQLLSERAALMGWQRNGPASVGGAFAPYRTIDGWFGLSLARPDDLDLVPALTGESVHTDPVDAVRRWASETTTSQATDRAVLLGLPAATISPRRQASRPPFCFGRPFGGRTRSDRPVVLELGSLWAAPLCGSMLQRAGARVVKVESHRRPDGTRYGSPRFFDLLNAGKASVSVDLTTATGIVFLRELLTRADAVIEASRPRALRQLGLDAESFVASGTVWTSITAHGRSGDKAQRVGFGDDVAAEGGLIRISDRGCFPCGDAIADPLTGVVAATATLAALRSDRGRMLDIPMVDVAASTVALGGPNEAIDDNRVVRVAHGWIVETRSGTARVLPPTTRAPAGSAPDLGRDTEPVRRWLVS